MIIKGTRKIAIEWLSHGHLLIAQGNHVIEMSPAQAVELMRSLEERDDPAIKDYFGEKRAIFLYEAECSKRGA